MKVYTGTGDAGKTSLFSGERVAKYDTRIDAYGAVDELNAAIGALIAALPKADGAAATRAQLEQIQSDLFHVGGWLATVPQSPAAAHLTPLTEGFAKRLESQIDAMDADLAPLNAFILPGGHPSAGWAHMARTICRRAERLTVQLADQDGLDVDGADHMLVYLNRLSDYLFILARHCNRMAGVEDTIWHA